MKKEQLFKAVGGAGDELLMRSEENGKRRAVPVKWAALAACFAVAALAVIIINIQAVPGELPILTITRESGQYGYEGYLAQDISELVNSNPWTEDMNVSVLPVYENTIVYDGNGFSADYSDYYPPTDVKEMKKFLKEVAKRLGFETDKLEITDDMPDEKAKKNFIEKAKAGSDFPDDFFRATSVFTESGNIKLEVNSDMTAVVNFEPPVTLPDEYTFKSTPESCPSYDEMRTLAGYLQKEYKDLIDMRNAAVNISGGYYTIYKQQIYDISIFEAGGDAVHQIINYNFNNVTFSCDEDGKLFIAKVFRQDLSYKVGDYPVITVEKAKELLKNGKYITSVPDDYLTLPIEDYAARVELIYKTGISNQYFMPFYHFLVELPNRGGADGMKEYGSYYVPAVEERYLSNMPITSN